jgi:hypothetical protein
LTGNGCASLLAAGCASPRTAVAGEECAGCGGLLLTGRSKRIGAL